MSPMSPRSDARQEIEREAGDLAELFRAARARTALTAGPALPGPRFNTASGGGRVPRAPVARWLRAAGVLIALALGVAGILFMDGDRYLLAEVRRTEGAVSLERTGAPGCAELVSGSTLRPGDVLRCGEGQCTVELSTGCLLVLSEGSSVRLDRAADGSLRLTLGTGTLDYTTSLPLAFVCLETRELKCVGPAALKGLGGPGEEVASGCVMLRNTEDRDTWSVLPCGGMGTCSTRPR